VFCMAIMGNPEVLKKSLGAGIARNVQAANEMKKCRCKKRVDDVAGNVYPGPAPLKRQAPAPDPSPSAGRPAPDRRSFHGTFWGV
jgi:hypothetical protein